MLKDALDDTRLRNGRNHLQITATIGAPVQINSEYPLQSRQPAHWRSARIGCGFIGAARFARCIGGAKMPDRSRALGANTPW